MSPNNIRQQGVFVSTGDPETVDDASMYAPGTLGARVTVKQPTRGAAGAEDYRYKTYQYVRGDSSMSVTPFKGAVMWWADKTAYQVTTDPTKLGRGRVAGICQSAPGAGNFFYVQTQGPGIVKFIDGVTAAPSDDGLIVVPSATAGKADALAAGSAATYPAIGVTAGALQGGTSEAVVDLDVPETP